MGDGTGSGSGTGSESSSSSSSSGEVAAYMSRGRTLAEIVFAVACVGFLTGFVAFLCIGNVYRARRAAERQRQRRLANKLLMTAPGVVGAAGSTTTTTTVLRHHHPGDDAARGFNYGGGSASRGLSGPLNGGDMSPQSSTSSSGVGGGEQRAAPDRGAGRHFFDPGAAQERTRLISHDAVARRRTATALAQTGDRLRLSEQESDESYEEFNFPSRTANLMSV